MCTRMTVRRGFKLIDLLVVTAIIAMVLVLILSGLPKIRNRQGDADCKSKLRQSVLAALNCHEQMTYIPANPSPYPNASKPTFYATTQTWLLPYMDAATVFAPISTGGLTHPATLTSLRIFQCHSDPTICTSQSPCCYVTNGNMFDGSGQAGQSVQNSLFNRHVILTEIKDGQANTIMFTEKLGYCSSWPQTVYPATGPVNRYPNQQYPSTVYTAVCYPEAKTQWAWNLKDSSGAVIPTGWNPSYIAAPPPGVAGTSVVAGYPKGSGFDPRRATAQTADCTRPQSGHYQQINVGMCDGSVKTVTTAVDPKIWYSYSTPNGREKPDSRWPP